jgi:hypothetical protein
MQKPYTVLEQFVTAKNETIVSEDLILITPNFISVLDGVTSKTKKEYRGTTGGRFAAEVIAETIENLPADIIARDAISIISVELKHAIQQEYPGSTANNAPGSQFSLYSAHRREIWRVGDVYLRINDTVHKLFAPPTDEILTNYRSALLHALIADGTSVEELIFNDPSWDFMFPVLSRQDLFANIDEDHPLAYGIVNGEHVPDRFIHIESVPADTEVVLATDGYLSPVGTLEMQEKALAETLSGDPLLIGAHKSFRPAPTGGSFDDRAWVRFITH